MKVRVRSLSAIFMATFALAGCINSDGLFGENVIPPAGLAPADAANPYLWRASLDTLESLPLLEADAVGGLIAFDWYTFPDAPDERIKATVYILDTRLRADGVTVRVFRQVKENGEWVDAPVQSETAEQIEARILEQARVLRVSNLER